MTKLTYPKTSNSQANSQPDSSISSQEEQIVQLKRLLVTLKQQYEENLRSLQSQLKGEVEQREGIFKELEQLKNKFEEAKKHHEEEQSALIKQQMTLKELFKATQAELKQVKNQSPAATPAISPQVFAANQARLEQLERMVPYLKERTQEANLENEQLHDEIEASQKKTSVLEAKLAEEQKKHQQAVQDLQEALQTFQGKEGGINADVYQEFSQVKQELVRSRHDNESLERRYSSLLEEKISAEQQVKVAKEKAHLQEIEIKNFKERASGLEESKQNLQEQVAQKERELTTLKEQAKNSETRLCQLDEIIHNKDQLQEKYEQLREELVTVTEDLEEALEARLQLEGQLSYLRLSFNEQTEELQLKNSQVAQFVSEQEHLQADRQDLSRLLEESESRLKVAQQHLAKKVKEAALLNERVDELQSMFNDQHQALEAARVQIGHLQTNIDLYQKQEKRLQEQLHEALKSTESQVAKWEEKYFRMYDKWQDSENKMRELKKFEEKHHQMQTLLSNLGTFMGGASFAGANLFQQMPETLIQKHEQVEIEEEAVVTESNKAPEDRYDLFGMRHPTNETLKQDIFS